jgi:hypothetical protein
MQPDATRDTPSSPTAATAPKPSPLTITLDHIRQAAEWARDARQRGNNEPTQIDGLPVTRRYDQGQWDCGTSCCMWGAAALIAGCNPVTQGPPTEWIGGDAIRVGVYGLLRSRMTTPDQMLLLLTYADLTYADLTGADLAGANLTDANLARANLTYANLTRANLARANLARANLTGADLTGVDLTDADLTRADLTGVDLTDANLTRADLARANLAGAHIWDASGKLYFSHTPPPAQGSML